MNSDFDVDEHYRFLSDIDELMDDLWVAELEKKLPDNDNAWIDPPLCEICKIGSHSTWECPDTGIIRCDECQKLHERDECSSCRLAYQDV